MAAILANGHSMIHCFVGINRISVALLAPEQPEREQVEQRLKGPEDKIKNPFPPADRQPPHTAMTGGYSMDGSADGTPLLPGDKNIFTAAFWTCHKNPPSVN